MSVVPTPHTLNLAARMVAAARHEPGADVALAMLPEYKKGQGVALVGAILAQVAKVAALPHDGEPRPDAGPPRDVDADCQEIVERACRAWSLTEEQLLRSGAHAVIQVRQVAMAAMCLRGVSYSSVGRFMSRDHTTVMHATETVLADLPRTKAARALASPDLPDSWEPDWLPPQTREVARREEAKAARADRIADLELLASAGESIEGAAERLGLEVKSLENWLRRAGRCDILRRLQANQGQ